ncbi:MAG: S-methyl-5'-thioadenosine phosphorylase [Nitrospirota bacterium]
MSEAAIGIIGGSGLYEMEGLKEVKEVKVETPFGDPSDLYISGILDDVKVAFLARHGRGHRLLPTEINYRANIFGMKKLGVERIISVSAVGSMKKEIKPGELVIPEQFYDHTKRRISTFFGEGIVAHVAFADPICSELKDILYRAGKNIGTVVVHQGGTYLCIEGPQFSSRGESNIYRSWGVDIIGMTNVTEAKLAREAEICYTTLAMATDYDCWHIEEESVTVEAILQILNKNVEISKKIIRNAVSHIPEDKGCQCGHSLKNAIITPSESIPQETKNRLAPIIGKYVN